jgi:hypothetical protein
VDKLAIGILYQPFKQPVKSHLLALLGAYHILHVNVLRVKKFYLIFADGGGNK